MPRRTKADEEADAGDDDEHDDVAHSRRGFVPASTAMRAMGSARNRSMRPLCRSSARPMAVPTAPKIVVCTRIPGMRKLTY